MAQLGYIEIIDNRCKGCDLCIPECPVEIIVKSSRVNRRGLNVVEVSEMSKCIACNLCAMICPDRAIDVYRFDKKALKAAQAAG
ncbi:MAG: 4Fe-4S dicluster domain-containing protein [Deltaproteobacteria bacterium]|nr:4Fe-4S dicluster domain-containing protein [Deltaproteobacteria bacterium]